MVESPPPLSASRRTVAAYVAVLKLARERGYVVTRLKMAKFLYLTDLAAVRESEDPVSGVEWRGPFNNSLQFLENELVERRVVQRDPYYQGFQIRLVGELPGYDMPAEDMAILEKTLTELGGLAAATLKDLSYQTPPMEDALQRERGVVLDLSLARPRPKLAKLARRMSAVLRRLPEQENDPGIGQELEREMAELAEGRRRATGVLSRRA
ncbi:hypothetical protein O7543_23125 [Solwaraspora sp. WMMA2080]|uniref:hypothetical protein n=1 Tax=Solwaraspora sp. WMMA2080 TaxID=3015165 RepID=UPI00248CD3DD|nr:hypothetical protein [Solwaraspora sp. WMMA2080]WBC19701.1 hypothetical protein O7543_23125 [Solwaraspora sp. WMMA2080]